MSLGMKPMPDSLVQFSLVIESLAAGPPSAGAVARPTRPAERGVAVPPGVSGVSRGSDGTLALAPIPPAPPTGLLLEPIIAARHQRFLLLLNSAPIPLRVNDDVAPPCVSLLKEGDSFGWDGVAVHVAVRRQPPIRPAGELVGQPCPVCLGAIEEADWVYRCDCGAVYHGNPPDSQRLQCARSLSRCLSCDRELVLRESFTDLSHLGL